MSCQNGVRRRFICWVIVRSRKCVSCLVQKYSLVFPEHQGDIKYLVIQQGSPELTNHDLDQLLLPFQSKMEAQK